MEAYTWLNSIKYSAAYDLKTSFIIQLVTIGLSGGDLNLGHLRWKH